MKSIGLALLIAMPASAIAVGVDEGLPIDRAWSGSRVWDDGLAEVAHYDSHRLVYAEDRTFETILITVKEDFDRARAVKADPPYEGRDLMTVLKLNIISRIDTQNYPYFYMASLFVRRDDPRQVVKLAASSQEWCGTTFRELVTWDGPPRLETHSYFDAQGDGKAAIELGDGVLLEEQLLLLARAADLRPGQEYRLRVYDSQIGNSTGPPALHPMVATLSGEESLVTPAGTFMADRLEVRPAPPASGQGSARAASTISTMVFWIRKGGERALLKFTSTDGRSLI
ncbi:MAG TPA: hypothetical protein VFE84_01805, partial [Patescibacteria group bacterium]|nr:hypothetical protein [Patescibacteria group bacterium]